MLETATVLDSIAEQVLETMFFSAVLGPAEEPVDVPRLTALVSFSGSHAGLLGVSGDAATANALAANFLGVAGDEVPPGQEPAVLGELANVLCGAVLGHAEPEGRFTIYPPQISDTEECVAILHKTQIQRNFETTEGCLTIGLTILEDGPLA
ncbi:hypothetical protein SBA3_1750014 [Candidatus Sulfopaludibacter sp. SbA3]|nr:hypothetical protein SBA3_1750014 [Candidatus Sulfopaludibacter sp. SbA3]